MSRLGRFGVALATATIVAIGLSGCSFLQRKSVPPPTSSEDPKSAACLVGKWHQTEGWQRLKLADNSILEVRLIKGGRDFTVTANGTATIVYGEPAVWYVKEKLDETTVEFTGSASLTYTAKDGTWSETADNSKVFTTETDNGTKRAPSAGGNAVKREYTYVCSSTDLILSTTDFRHAFKRA